MATSAAGGGAASESELQRIKEELKSALERRGVISTLKSRIRSEIYHCLDSRVPSDPHMATVDADAPEENTIINELIREYLVFNGYTNTLSVFVPEARQPQRPALERVFLQSELGLHAEDPEASRTALPLLYAATSKLRRSRSAFVAGSSARAPSLSSLSAASMPLAAQTSSSSGGSGGGGSSSRAAGGGYSANEYRFHPRDATDEDYAAARVTPAAAAAAGFAESQKLVDLDKPSPISFKNI